MSKPDNRAPDLYVPIACDLDAIPDGDRAAHIDRAGALLFAAYEERRELVDGYAWRFGAHQFDEVAAYVANERRCCPFFTFTLEVTPAGGPLWLRVTGTAEAKAYLTSELAIHSAP